MNVTLLELYRREAGLSIKQLAELANYVPNAISQIERGHRKPWPALRERISEVLNVSQAEVFTADGWPKTARIKSLLSAANE